MLNSVLEVAPTCLLGTSYSTIIMPFHKTSSTPHFPSTYPTLLVQCWLTLIPKPLRLGGWAYMTLHTGKSPQYSTFLSSTPLFYLCL